MTLWEFALAAWRRPGVEEVCLKLQDQDGQSVALLLWAAWTASEGRKLDGPTIAAALSLARAWEGMLTSLRVARRGLSQTLPGLADAQRADWRAELQAFELAAERALAQALEAATPPASRAAQSLDGALNRVAERWSDAPPTAGLRALAAKLK